MRNPFRKKEKYIIDTRNFEVITVYPKTDLFVETSTQSGTETPPQKFEYYRLPHGDMVLASNAYDSKNAAYDALARQYAEQVAGTQKRIEDLQKEQNEHKRTLEHIKAKAWQHGVIILPDEYIEEQHAYKETNPSPASS